MEHEQILLIDDIPIKYIFKRRKYDTKHLVIVFSGFGGDSEFTYDFLNIFRSLHANVLWIKDDFFGHCSYYLAHKNDFKIESSVIQLIHHFIDEVGVSKNEVTILGASKGGSAALFYGLKYNFRNIIASVPQLLIGDYVTSIWPHVAEHMLGEHGSSKDFDLLILDQIRDDINTNKNIYLLTSEVDVQYEKHIDPFIKCFYRYENFNALFSESILVREHNQITAHHTDVIMGIVLMLSANLAPRFGMRVLLGDKPLKRNEPSDTIVELKEIFIEDNRLFLNGVGIVRGKEAREYSDIDYKLIFISASKDISINIAKAHRPFLTKQFYNGNLCIYDKCWFTTYKYQGVELSCLPIGRYKIHLEITIQGYSVREALVYKGKLFNSETIELQSDNNNLYLEIKQLFS